MHRSDDDIPAEIDFSGGKRGKFYREGMQLKLPLYLDEELQTRLTRLASARGVDVTQLVNEMLRDDLERMGA